MEKNGAELKPGERIDDLGRRGYKVIQNPDRFCFGVDAALLSWFSSVRDGERVIDLGTGTGIIPILMDARYACGSYVGLELMADMAEMAGRSVQLNGIEDHVEILQGDLRTASERFGKASFDVVTSNPPYMPVGAGLPNPDPGKAAARHEVFCTLDDVLREAAKLLKVGGRFYMVHRPARLPGILSGMKTYGIAPSRLVFVHPYAGKEASMVLVSGTRGGKDILKVEAPVIIYEEPSAGRKGNASAEAVHTGPEYTKQLKEIYNE